MGLTARPLSTGVPPNLLPSPPLAKYSMVFLPIARPTEYLPILPARINESIAPYALLKVREQWELAKHCTGSFTKVWGLPCCHDIADALSIQPQWTLSRLDIDEHWYFERPEHRQPQPALRLPSPPAVRQPLVQEPLVVRSSGRPRADDRQCTTRRDTSHLEQPVGRTPEWQAAQQAASLTATSTTVHRVAQQPQTRGRGRGTSHTLCKRLQQHLEVAEEADLISPPCGMSFELLRAQLACQNASEVANASSSAPDLAP
ncbi:hypothetical protein V8E54_012002 [Elaphomyces granulatus]